MKSENIVKKLQKEGYKIAFKKWSYWDNIPHVVLDGFSFAIAEHVHQKDWLGCNINFIYNHVQHALNIAQRNNPVFLKKIEQVPSESWYYSRYLILNMLDYYNYMEGVYPFNEYLIVLKKLKKELE